MLEAGGGVVSTRGICRHRLFLFSFSRANTWCCTWDLLILIFH
ncbi:unnamed protein product [Arabidopsis lyrata]|nr:unnamed protein product [Arabidopsis lyrata]